MSLAVTKIALGVGHLSLIVFLICLSLIIGLITAWGTWRSLKDCQVRPGAWPAWCGVVAAGLSATLAYAVIEFHAQLTPDVLPQEMWRNWRIVYHAVLISLLVMVSATDLRTYYILVWTCWLGLGLGVIGATVSGDFQLMHVWIDWTQEVPQLRGPFRPAWLSDHPHWHGLAWSLCGAIAGTVVTWFVQQLSKLALGKPALGTGDIYLMAMAGTFLGWQATLIAFALAPVLALAVGIVVNLTSSRSALPYGPFLSLSLIVTLFFWRQIWMLEVPLSLAPDASGTNVFSLRHFFGDWLLMIIAAAIAITLLVVLLGGLRFYKSFDLKGSKATEKNTSNHLGSN